MKTLKQVGVTLWGIGVIFLMCAPMLFSNQKEKKKESIPLVGIREIESDVVVQPPIHGQFDTFDNRGKKTGWVTIIFTIDRKGMKRTDIFHVIWTAFDARYEGTLVEIKEGVYALNATCLTGDRHTTCGFVTRYNYNGKSGWIYKHAVSMFIPDHRKFVSLKAAELWMPKVE